MKFEETSLTFDLKLSETTPIDTEFDALQTIHGKDGVTPHIGDNGNWYIGDEDTGVKAQGVDGKDGENGKDGVDGKDGYTPQKGVDYFDGKDGEKGENGADGYTPVKGTDYFTEADKAEMVSAVLASLPSAEGVGF